ncbi:MAG: hypothetical protein M3024_10575 [Candidatus Dormibacteraeota bacterium]|nr:hypothetical protein [Candidatus Dormibacteraeota bacterium]
MILLVVGASAAGKTTALGTARDRLRDVEVRDFDEIGVPEHADGLWRLRANERWVRHAIASTRHLMLSGQTPLGELLASPSADRLDGIAACLLDCHDVVRIRRLRQRGRPAATQDQLNWAAWHRLHATDPQWERDVIEAPSRDLPWDRWRDWQEGDPRWSIEVIDTTCLLPIEVGERLVDWADRQLAMWRAGTLPLRGRWWD